MTSKQLATFGALHQKAIDAGLEAVSKLQVVPMGVVQHADPLNDASPAVKAWVVPDGVCGFAYVHLKPANAGFAKYLVAQGVARKDSYLGGITLSVHAFNQSLQKKEAYAIAFAAVLQEAGLNAHASSRMD